MNREFDVLVYIGRFQPFHNAHRATVEHALTRADQVFIVIGSANRPRSERNPFSFEERAELIRAIFSDRADRLRFIAMRDFFDEQRWAKTLRSDVERLVGSTKKIGLIGHRKNASSTYLDDFPAWPFVEMGYIDALDATPIRQAWLEDGSVPEETLPSRTAAFLKQFAAREEYAELQLEHRFLQAYKRAWSAAPYPPIFVTVDTVVRCGDRVLLIKRGGFPGRGLWALPGGFLDQDERIDAAALRELEEETGLRFEAGSEATIRKGSRVFDHPRRSQRGRTVTHAFYFDLGSIDLPQVAAADDAVEAAWWPIETLKRMEHQMLDDHFVILEHFLWPEG